MPDFPHDVYLDANTVLHFLMETPEKHEILDQLFLGTQRPTFWTSTVSIVEVAYFAQTAGLPSINQGLSQIEHFWAERHVTLIEPTQQAMEMGRDFMRACVEAKRTNTQNSIRNRSIDAVHLGCARWVEAQELWTFDTKFIDLGPYSPSVIIREPWLEAPPLFDITNL